MKQWLLPVVCIGFLAVSGCGNQTNYDPKWMSYSSDIGGQWQVNKDHYDTVSNTKFQWTIYVGTKAKQPDFTYWTTGINIKQLSNKQAESQLRNVWQTVPKGTFYFYQVSTPTTAWVELPSTKVEVATSQQNSQDSRRLVQSIFYGNVFNSPILLTSEPVELTSITTNSTEQSITFTFEPLNNPISS